MFYPGSDYDCNMYYRFKPSDRSADSENDWIRPEEVVHDILHQLRVQMEPAFVKNFIASLTPASRDWISLNEDQAQAKVAEVLRTTGMSLDQLKALLDSNSKK